MKRHFVDTNTTQHAETIKSIKRRNDGQNVTDVCDEKNPSGVDPGNVTDSIHPKDNCTDNDNVATLIAKTALHHYENVLPPKKGKPKENEWTVYAAIVATNNENDCWVVSCATGTKCTSPCHTECFNNQSNRESRAYRLCILADSHAEVMARRGLLRVFWNEINQMIQNKDENEKNHDHLKITNFVTQSRMNLQPDTGFKHLLEEISVTNESEEDKNQSSCSSINMIDNIDNNNTPPFGQKRRFRLRPGLQIHLYVSDSPCGDASLYHISKDVNPEKLLNNPHSVMQFTGAKVIVSHQTNVTVEACGGEHQILDTKDKTTSSATADIDSDNVPLSSCIRIARENDQILGQLRTKSGRSNIESNRRSVSMSCSDKIVRWCLLGIQGGFLSKYLPDPISFATVVVSRDRRVAMIHETQKNEQFTNSQWVALDRAISSRIIATKESLRQNLNLEGYEISCNNFSNNSKSIDTAAAAAVLLRIERISIPSIVIVYDQIFCRSKSEMEYSRDIESSSTMLVAKTKRMDHKILTFEKDNDCIPGKRPTMKYSPAGVSINWQQSSSGIELIVGSRGIKQGKKPKSINDYKALQSRLSSQAIVNLAQARSDCRMPPDVDDWNQELKCYRKFKHNNSCPLYLNFRNQIFQKGPLAGWIVDKTYEEVSSNS